MADVTVYKQASVALVVVDGDPPDVAALTQQVATLTAERDLLRAKVAQAIVVLTQMGTLPA